MTSEDAAIGMDGGHGLLGSLMQMLMTMLMLTMKMEGKSQGREDGGHQRSCNAKAH
jgi:hypothetical protein